MSLAATQLLSAAHHLLRPETIDTHDSVLVPDGRVGRVIGFYRRQHETVVVQFRSGGSDEFLTADVRPYA